MMLRRLAPVVALLALAIPARAEEPPATSGEADETASGTQATNSAPAPSSSVAVQPPAEGTEGAPKPVDHRPRSMRALALDLREALSLRQFIETTPLVVAGLKLYIEAEPIAVRQRPETASQLTVAVAYDRVVLIGAF